MTRVPSLGGALLVLACTLGVAHGSESPGTKCAVAKIQAAGKRATGEIACYTKALKKSVAVDPACLAKVDAKFSAAFAKADAKAKGFCASAGEATGIGNNVDTFVNGVVQAEPACHPSGDFCVFGVCCPGLNCVLGSITYECQ